MSKRWRLAGLFLAVAVFSYTLLTGKSVLPLSDDLPIVVSALYAAGGPRGAVEGWHRAESGRGARLRRSRGGRRRTAFAR